MHSTPTSRSWLKQVESWFARIERDGIARGIFPSTTDLTRTLLRYITLHHETCEPFVWRYRSVTPRTPDTRTSTTPHSCPRRADAEGDRRRRVACPPPGAASMLGGGCPRSRRRPRIAGTAAATDQRCPL